MKFRLKWKDIQPDPERGVFIFDTVHPLTKEKIHVEQKPKTTATYDQITAEIEKHLTEINKLRETEIEVETPPPFTATVERKKPFVSEYRYTETIEIND